MKQHKPLILLGNTLEEKLGVGRLVWNDKDGDGKVDLIPEYWSREEVVANADKLKQDAITKFAEELDVFLMLSLRLVK